LIKTFNRYRTHTLACHIRNMISKTSLSALFVFTLPLAARAHIALWDDSMFGWNDDPNQMDPALPLADLSFNDWWLHGAAYRNAPPKEGKFMELPSGGVYHGYTSCSEFVIFRMSCALH
jgi:hypothetical protein